MKKEKVPQIPSNSNAERLDKGSVTWCCNWWCKASEKGRAGDDVKYVHQSEKHFLLDAFGLHQSVIFFY